MKSLAWQTRDPFPGRARIATSLFATVEKAKHETSSRVVFVLPTRVGTLKLRVGKSNE